MDDTTDVLRRLDRVEARVDAISAVPSTRVTDHPRDTIANDIFWALDGLKERAGGAGAIVYAGNPAIAALGHPVRLEIMYAILGGVSSVSTTSRPRGSFPCWSF